MSIFRLFGLPSPAFLDEAARLSDRIGFLVDGTLRAEGTLDDLVAEAFGGDQHLEVELEDAPAEDVQTALASLGLAASRDPTRWLGTHAGGLATLGAVESSLTNAGVHARRVSIVEPGLREVFLRMTGRELDR